MSKLRNVRRRHASCGVEAAPPVAIHLGRRRWLLLSAFAIVFITLEVNSYTRTSATWDEPIHLTSGYAALAHQDYRIDPSHPPFARLWAALPLLVLHPTALDTARVDRAVMPGWLAEAYGFAHEYLYTANDADRLLYPARFMAVLLGVLLGILLFSWVHEWLGLTAAVVALLFYLLEPNLAAHAMLVTTDFPLTCFVFGATYFLWRTCRSLTPSNVAAVAIFVALAVVTKFSAVLLIPVVGALLVIAVARRHLALRDAAIVAGVLVLTTYVLIWMAYGFRFSAGPAGSWLFHLQDSEFARDEPAVARVIGWIDDHRLLPNAFTQGFLYNDSSVRKLGAFLGGRYSSSGWWYYFPIAFALKTPLSLVAMIGIGVMLWRRRRESADSPVAPFVIVPIVVFLGVPMLSGINIGLRHILPIYPFLLLIAAVAAQRLMAVGKMARVALLAALLAAVVEFSTAYPHNLTFFNRVAGGPQNGFRYLADSNLGWGQNLKPLKRWMDRHGVRHINLAYFGQADPAYYGIDCTYLPGSSSFATSSITRPRLPGYVAISSTVLSGVYLQPGWRVFYRPFLDAKPEAVIGNSMRVYWVERWPDTTTPRDGGGPAADVHRFLGDALLFGAQWPTRAMRHYREYLKQRPSDAHVMFNAAIALVASDDIEGAVAMLHRTIAVDPNNGQARLMLAKALLARHDLDGARMHAERAVELLSDSADAHDVLGRVRAIEGRFDEADRYFKTALSLAPDNASARENLQRVDKERRARDRSRR